MKSSTQKDSTVLPNSLSKGIPNIQRRQKRVILGKKVNCSQFESANSQKDHDRFRNICQLILDALSTTDLSNDSEIVPKIPIYNDPIDISQDTSQNPSVPIPHEFNGQKSGWPDNINSGNSGFFTMLNPPSNSIKNYSTSSPPFAKADSDQEFSLEQKCSFVEILDESNPTFSDHYNSKPFDNLVSEYEKVASPDHNTDWRTVQIFSENLVPDYNQPTIQSSFSNHTFANHYPTQIPFLNDALESDNVDTINKLNNHQGSNFGLFSDIPNYFAIEDEKNPAYRTANI